MYVSVSQLTVAPERNLRLKIFAALAFPPLTATFFFLNGHPLPLQKT